MLRGKQPQPTPVDTEVRGLVGHDKRRRRREKSTVNPNPGNYTKPKMRKRMFQRIKAGSKGGPANKWSARKAQLLALAYKRAGGGYRD